jgi:ribose-phosphate pyrophosphokinase
MNIQTQGTAPSPIEFVTFPGGERMPRLAAIPANSEINLYTPIVSANDILDLHMVVDALRRMKVGSIVLQAPFIMGARQDRVCNEGEPLAAKVIATMINALELDLVVTQCPHSDVLPALINNCKAYDFTYNLVSEHIANAEELQQTLVIVAPDGGASKRVFKLCTAMEAEGRNVVFLEGSKKRDMKTGNIVKFGCEPYDFTGEEQVLLVDDICANGGTFIGLSKLLQERGAAKPDIFVYHFDSGQGLTNISGHFDRVFSTNSTGRSKQVTKAINILQI